MLESKITSHDIVRAAESAYHKFNQLPTGIIMGVAKKARSEMIREAAIHSLQMEDEESRILVEKKSGTQRERKRFKTLIEQMTVAVGDIKRKIREGNYITVDDLVNGHSSMFLPPDRLRYGGLRRQNVRVTGVSGASGWTPPECGAYESQLQTIVDVINEMMKNGAFLDASATVHLGITYLQPFVDGNKRTARTFANAILASKGLPPAVITVTEKELYFARYLRPAIEELRRALDYNELSVTHYNDQLKPCRPFYDFVGQKVVLALGHILHKPTPDTVLDNIDNDRKEPQQPQKQYGVIVSKCKHDGVMSTITNRLRQKASMHDFTLRTRRIDTHERHTYCLLVTGPITKDFMKPILDDCATKYNITYKINDHLIVVK